jgi:hypothetical protein
VATLIRILLAAATLAAAPAPPKSAPPPPRKLSDAEFVSATKAIDGNTVPASALIREQSFSIDEHTWVLAYFNPPPGGYFKTGEDGVVVVRDGKVTDVQRMYGRSQIIGVDAIAFFDANADGVRDIVMLGRELALPGPRERTQVLVYVAAQNATYPLDRKMSALAVGPAEHPSKTVADVRARLKEAVQAEAAPSSPPTHAYKLDGDLDGKKLSCRGKALVEEAKDDDGVRCVEWTLEQVKCKGKGDADWLHRDGASSSSICFKDGAWQYAHEVDGLSSCEVVLPEASKSAKVPPQKSGFMLTCTWACRGSGRDGCSGGASYDFTPLPRTKP